ncbi:MAG: tetratricopeptide repeat protein [Endozoicomonas sp.]
MKSLSISPGLLPQWLKAVAVSLPVLAVQVAVTSSLPSVAVAEESKPQEKTRRTPALRNKVYEKLSEAQKASEEELYDEALVILDELKGRTGKRALNSYELANVYNLYAFIYYTREQFDRALKAYQSIVVQSDIPVALETNTRYTIAQLLMLQERWKEGVEELNRWFAMSSNQSASAYILRGQAYYQLKQYDNSLRDMEKAIAMNRAKGKPPKEQWLGLVRFLHYEKGNFPKVIEVLEELLVLYPKKDYWVQLSHMYGELGKESKQMSAMESAYLQGFLTRESELLNMAYLYLSAEVPLKSGMLLEKAMKAGQVKRTAKNMELLASSWRRAQELDKAIVAMRDAAGKSNKGELWAQLGNIYVDKEEYGKAIEAITSGLKKGGVKRPDSARLSLGMAYFNTKKYRDARKAFNDAKKDKRSKKYADQWLKYMAREIAREKSLQSG